MTQTFVDNCFQSGNVGQTDLQNIENNFAAVKSNFSGTTAPSNVVAGMAWFDMDSGVGNQGVLKLRDDNNATWFGLLHGDATHIMLVYRNTALDGWAVDSTAGNQDTVVAIKGGATYTTGGAVAGSWTISGLSSGGGSAHSHSGGAHTHALGTTATALGYYPATSVRIHMTGNKAYEATAGALSVDQLSSPTAAGSGNTGNESAHTHTVSQSGAWRIRASVFTLQYIDI
jgi:hypothetical protein